MKTQKPDSETDFEVQAENRETGTKTNNIVFGILTVITQITLTFIYGFLANVPAINTTSSNSFAGSIIPVFLPFGMMVVVLIGFALIFAYVKKLVWSSIGFALLLTCLTIEWYFIFNAFWTKVDLGGDGTWDQVFNSDKTFNIYLSNAGAQIPSGGTSTNGATLTQALQCSLANLVAFSAILGKAGPLQIWILSVVGTFGYELNRKLIQLMNIDYGGTFGVFVFGGFLGLFMGIFLNLKYRGENTTARNAHYNANTFSVALSLTGNLIVWSLFSVLTMDPEFDSRATSSFQLYTVPILIFFGMAASTLVSIGISSIINHSILVRDAVQGPLAGAIAVASAAYFITNPVYALVIGCVAGAIQTVWQNYVEKKRSKRDTIVNTFSFCLFGIQGLIGSVFASGFRHALYSQTNGQTFTNLDSIPYPVFNFVTAIISAGIGIFFGIVIGLLMYCAGKHEHEEHFHDFTYWVNDDGIRYELDYYIDDEEESVVESEDLGNFYIKETAKDIKMKHAYL